MSVKSLKRLEQIIKGKGNEIMVITGHTGYTWDLDFAFKHIDKVCNPLSKKFYNPNAPYDGYDESDDIKENVKKYKI